MFLRASILAGLLALAAGPALAAPPEGDPKAHAETAVNFFAKTCLGHFRDHPGLQAKVGAQGEWKLPVMMGGLEKVFLGGAPGKAWLLRKDGGTFALAIREDGMCSVFARRADEIRVLEEIEKLLRPGNFFTGKEVDSDHEKVLTRRFFDVKAGDEALKMVVSTTREAQTSFQAAFSLAPPGKPAQPPVMGQ